MSFRGKSEERLPFLKEELAIPEDVKYKARLTIASQEQFSPTERYELLDMLGLTQIEKSDKNE